MYYKIFLIILLSFVFYSLQKSTLPITLTSNADQHIKSYTDNYKQCLRLENRKDDISQITLFDVQPNDVVLGDPNANVTAIEYSSFSCSHCLYYHKNIFPLIEDKYIKTNKIRYVIREFITNDIDLKSAVLARAGYQTSSTLYLELLNTLFEKNQSLHNKNYLSILQTLAQFAGITIDVYDAFINDLQLKETLVNNSKNIFNYKQFAGTPFVVVNGIKVTNYNILSDVIDKYLSIQ